MSGASLVLLVALFAALAGTAALYLHGTTRLRRRGVRWPHRRDTSFLLGCLVLGFGGSISSPDAPFTGHMLQHLMIGMLAPLLLVCGRPVTVLLRSPGALRTRLLAVTRSRLLAALLFPPVAALISVGSLFLLYRTPIFEATHQLPLVHAAVHAHLLMSGMLFTVAVSQLDPVRHRYPLAIRAAALVAAGAAHAVLAKSLYGTPPPGSALTELDLQRGAQLMYYGGDVIEVLLAVVLALSWYTAQGRIYAREQRRAVARS